MMLIEYILDILRSDLEPLSISELPRALLDVSIWKAAQEISKDYLQMLWINDDSGLTDNKNVINIGINILSTQLIRLWSN